MIIVVIIAGVFAAACNAGSSVLQRVATGRPNTDELFSRAFAVAVTRHPVFLAGFGLQVLAAILQAVALSQGPISLVAPLLTLDLVFLLIFLNFRSNLHAGTKEWSGVALIVAGLSGLFIAGRPEGGTTRYALAPWIVAMVAATLVMAACMVAARRVRTAKARAALVSVATASMFALNTGFTKLALHQFQTMGALTVLRSWPVYALIISGILSVYLMQNMYGAGPLVVSQPIIETLSPAISITIGIVIFGETFRHTNALLGAEAFCALLLFSGIILLASSKKISPGYSDNKT